jgi:hypothetical protein
VLSLVKQRQLVVGNLGWADGPCVWTFDIKVAQEQLVFAGPPKYITLTRYGDVLRIVQLGAPYPRIVLRLVTNLEVDCATLEILEGEAHFTGDAGLWQDVDPCVLLFGQTTKLLHVDGRNRRTAELDLAWYRDGDYDLGYQGLVDCLTLPGREYVVVSVQRSSTLVVLDIRSSKKVAEVELAGRHGNPHLQFFEKRNIITTDGDTICLVDWTEMKKISQISLEDERNGFQCFVGDPGLDAEGIVVARPYSGDVLVLDRQSFKIVGRAVTGLEPLEAVQIGGSMILARDWKTGTPLTASVAEVNF